MSSDPLREIRTMTLVCFPCPPLPQLVLREDGGVTDYINSHDTIACGMQASLMANDTENEDARKILQLKLQQSYNAKMDELFTEYKNNKDPEIIDRVYEVMQNYTRRAITCYSPQKMQQEDLHILYSNKSDLADVRFQSIDEVCKSDIVHKKACEHLVAQRIVVGRESGLLSMTDVKNMSYRGIIEKFFVLYSEDAYKEA